MRGLDISADYYESIIRPLIEEHFPQLSGSYAAALIGWGSDVLGNDDDLSRDHEWGPRCYIFLPDSLFTIAEDLRRLFNTRIPSEFMGYPTRFTVLTDLGFRIPSRDGSGEVHIEITTHDKYLTENLGIVIPRDDVDWLSLPENKLLEFTDGRVFFDGTGELTASRSFFQAYYPTDVWKYRLAYIWQSLGWDMDLIGMCDSRGDFISSRNCISTTLFRIMKLTFLLNRKYSPAYPKWFGKEFYKLPSLSSEIGPILESCYIDTDVKSVVGKLEAVCDIMIGYQNTLNDLPPVEKTPSRIARGFWKIDLQHIADQVVGSITGPLREISLDSGCSPDTSMGAVDQWITNYDFLLDANKLRLLSVVYKHKTTDQ